MSAFGRNRDASAPASSPADRGKKTNDKSGGGLFSRFTSSIPFVGGGGEDKSQRVSKTRQAQSKIPRAKDDAGLSLDDKLDILGVGLVVTALVLFVSSLSPQQGAITGSINDLISQTFGWGSFAVPVACMAVGLWLIVRHFGDDAPEVDPVRITGIVMLYIGALMLFQFIETFNEIYKFATPETLYLFVRESIEQGRGGGTIGAELYYLVISNVGELPGITLILGWMVIGLMLATRTSAGELAVFVISIWRSFQVSVQQRAQARAMAQLEAREAQQQISVSRPNAGELAAGSAGALPAPSAQMADDDDYIPIEERAIPIRMGGQMITANEPVMAQSATPQNAVASQSASQPTNLPPTRLPDEDSSSGGRFGGIAARLKSAVPALPSLGSGNSDDTDTSNGKDTNTSEDSGGLLGGLFNRRSSSSGNADAPASTPVTASAASSASVSQSPPPRTMPQERTSTPLGNLMPRQQPTADDRLGGNSRPAASFTSPATSTPAQSAPPPSRVSPYSPQPTTASSAPSPSRFVRDLDDDDDEEVTNTNINRAGAAQNPFNRIGQVASVAAGAGAALLNNMDNDDDYDDDEDSDEISVLPPEDDMFSRLPPAQPKGVTRRPEPTNSLASRYSRTTTSNSDLDDDDDEDSSEMPAASVGGSNAIADRINRMNAIRSGTIQPTAGADARRSLELDDDEFKADFVDDFDEDDEDDDESVGFSKPSSSDIFGKRPSASPMSPTPATSSTGNGDANGSRVRSFDVNRYRETNTTPNTATTSPAASVSGSSPANGSFDRTARTSPVPSSPAPSAPSTPPAEQQPAASSPPWRTETTPTQSIPAPVQQQPPAAQQPAATQPPVAAPRNPVPQQQQPAAPPVSEPQFNQRHVAQPSEPVINLPQAPRPSQQPAVSKRQWRLPDYRTLLASGSEQDFDREGLVKRARVIEETLQSFGAPGRVVEINTGPVITQFGVEPDYLTARGGKKSRVKVSAIAQLDKDLQLALGAKSIRVEAPVPGKGYVGIEVPNEEASLVSLRDVMEARQFTKISEKSPLAIALGQSVDGAPISADLASMPHLLIAGTTGSGKSVCVNAVIASILIRNTPEQVKFIMVDPKRVELTGYNGIPHLVAPVVVELERIVGVLKWVTREMDERYKKFSEAGRRNIDDYNKNLTAPMDPMPYIVVIIDELADLMMLAPDETERVITRIAALARATGIHLVIATQRPSVDVVTGLIKANFPSRIAFAVASGTDSRVILDQPGADRLLGRGDMLYMSGDSPAPQRLQGVFVSDMEINNITRYWRTQAPPDAPQKPITALVMDDSPAPQSRTVMPRGERFMQPPPSSTQRAFWDSNNDSDDDLTEGEVDAQNQEDELYTDAVELVRRLNKASVSLLQRRLRIGYTRAARMIDMMEAENIIGPPTEGSKPREVLPYKK